jgi:4-hydroxy-tetrahydrodipicolinate synthase
VKAFSGVLTAIATPFDAKGHIDGPAFQGLVKHLKQNGTHGIVVAGTTGESPNLSKTERQELYEMALEFQSQDFKIYAGTGTNSTQETITTTAEALQKRFGAREIDGAMVVVPYYNRPTAEGLKAHFGEVFKSFPDKKLCLYNVPGRTGAVLLPTTALEIFEEHDNCVAIKEAAGDLSVVAALALGLRERKLQRELLSGDDPTFAPALLCGATGVISVSTHIIPKAMVAMWKAWAANDLAALQQLHLNCLKLNTDLFCVPNPIGLKWMLSEMGLCQNTFRLPLTPATEVAIQKLKAAFQTIQNQCLK